MIILYLLNHPFHFVEEFVCLCICVVKKNCTDELKREKFYLRPLEKEMATCSDKTEHALWGVKNPPAM